MNHFQLRPTNCDKHKNVTITYDANSFEECPMCRYEEMDEEILNSRIENENLTEEVEELSSELSIAETRIEDLLYEINSMMTQEQ